MINKIVGTLESLLKLNRATETLLIDLVAAISPWLAPILPAYITGASLLTQLKFPWYIALISACVVELVGLSSVATALMLWSWNETKRESDQSAPVWLAVIAAIMYVAVVLTVNTMLDQDPLTFKIAKALLSCLSIVAAIIIAVRGQHARRMAAKEAERQERKLERLQKRQEEYEAERLQKVSETFGNLPQEQGVDWRRLPVEEKEAIGQMSTRDVMVRYGVQERTAINWKKYSRNNGYH